MKKHIKRFNWLFLFLALSGPLPALATGREDDAKKTKKINKSYTVTRDDKLEIENSFGDVVVNTWDKNEITVDIEIVANGSTEERAQAILDEIDVKESRSGHFINFKTKVGEINNNGKRHRSEGGDKDNRTFYIDYVIHMPAANPLQIENSFGKTTVPDFNGEVNLTSKFGSLHAGKLTNVDAIDVEFGSVTIAELNNGKVNFKFNNKGSRIARVNGSVKISSEFSHNVEFKVDDNIRELTLNESYSSIRMVVDKNLSAEFDVHTSFGKFHNDSEFNITEKKEDESDYGPHFDKDYNGKAGDGKARIKIKSSFGSVRLSHSEAGTTSKDKDDDEDNGDKKTKHRENISTF